tara:strand:+ start:10329 stop:11198 length:870 start_codon:yes stop_codon:yes gene_type:complete
VKSFLNGVRVLDLTARLPGPLATYCLSLSGAEVTKIENSDWGEDPFKENLSGLENFQDWYRNLNKDKTIEIISFKDNQSRLIDAIESSEIIIAPHSKRIKKLILERARGSCVFLDSSQTLGGMHDLNALAVTKTFALHLIESIAPPYLPFAGISFGQLLAQQALAAYIANRQSGKFEYDTIYLDESAKLILDSLYSSFGPKVLHNGLFPCYNIYLLADGGHVALAAVEEHYWAEFNQVFNLNLTSEERLDTTGVTQEKIRNLFTNLTTNEIKEKLKNRQFCLTLIDKNN